YGSVETPDSRTREAATGGTWGANGASLTQGVAPGLGQHSDNHNQRFGISYVPGSHAIKVGVQTMYGRHYQVQEINEALNYTFRNGSPISITQFASPFIGQSKVPTLGGFAEGQSTVRPV